MSAVSRIIRFRECAGKQRGVVIRTALLFAGVLCLALPGFAGDQFFQKSYPLPSGGSFLLENVNGSIQIDGWARDEVEVRAVKIAQYDSRDLTQVKIDVENRPGQVFVRTLYPQGKGAEVLVKYHVYVPSRVLLSAIETVNGDVLVRGIAGAGDLRSVNGNVEVLGSSGWFNARTTNGNLRLELSKLRAGAPMNLETVNGSVVLGLPPNADANLTVLHMNGGFSSELPMTSAMGAATARSFHAKLGAGGGEISVRTVNGGIRLVREPNV